jgi:hypothetical protein
MSTLSTTNLKNPSSGSNNIVLGADGSTTIPTLSATTITGTTITGTSVRGGITSGTAVASTSGVAIDFTGIPSWAKRLTVMFNGVSTSGTSIVQIQLGSTSFSTSGYKSTASYGSATSAQYSYATSGFVIDPSSLAAASNTRAGLYVFSLIGSNTWVGSGNIGGDQTVGQLTAACAGNSPALSGALDRVRVTTVNGTDTFDAGSINILWEG